VCGGELNGIHVPSLSFQWIGFSECMLEALLIARSDPVTGFQLPAGHSGTTGEFLEEPTRLSTSRVGRVARAQFCRLEAISRRKCLQGLG